MTVVDLANYMAHRNEYRKATIELQVENLTNRRFECYRRLGFSPKAARGFATRFYNALVRELNSHYREGSR